MTATPAPAPAAPVRARAAARLSPSRTEPSRPPRLLESAIPEPLPPAPDPRVAIPSLAPALPGAGVRYVLVFKEGDWPAWSGRLDGLVPTLDRPELALYLVPAQPAEVRFPTPPVAPVVAVDLLVLALLVWAGAGPSLPIRPRRLVSSARHRQGGPQ